MTVQAGDTAGDDHSTETGGDNHTETGMVLYSFRHSDKVTAGGLSRTVRRD
jgi:hypothetical protein